MRRFKLYLQNSPERYVRKHYFNQGYAVNLDKPEIEGIVFSDGKVAIRWCSLTSSISIWDSIEDFKKIHGHDEYGSAWEWLDTSDQDLDASYEG